MRRAWVCVALIAVLSACVKQDDGGVVEVKWDRDMCRGCGMVISDRHFAAQVRGGPKNEAFKFDDIGCAMRFLAKQPWAGEAATRVFVARYADGAWVDAHDVHYEAGKASPMGFNFAAVDPSAGGVTYDEMRAQVLAGPGH